MTIKRPEVLEETILEASKIVAKTVEGDAKEIAACYYSHIDGYELAKKLESQYSWGISVHMVEELDGIQYEVDAIHEKVCKQWFIDEDIKPPFENGTKIKEGVIDGVCQYGVAQYKVIEYGETVKDRYRIIKFENAVEV